MLTMIYSDFSAGGFLNSRKALTGGLLLWGAQYTRTALSFSTIWEGTPVGAWGEPPEEPGGHTPDRPSLGTAPGLSEQVVQSRAQDGILVQ